MSSLSALLDRLDAAKREFVPTAQPGTFKLLAQLGHKKFPDAASLIRFHEALLFFRAYPANEEIRRSATALLASFQERVAKLSADLEPFEEPDVSGISGTTFSAIFTYDIARWLLTQHPKRVDIDWDATDPALLGPLLRRLHPYFAEDLLVEANIPYMEWFRAAKKERGRDLAWLISRIEKFPMTPEDRAELYAGAKIAIRWDLGHGPMTRSNIHLSGARKYFYHDGPLLRRADVSLANELASAKIPTQKISRAKGEEFLNLARETSAMRYRELHGFTYGDPANVIHADLGRGVEVFVNGVPKTHRLPLRTYHSGMYFKNGVPIGYIECLTFSDRMEVGFNLYYTFREGETAWLYGRLLHLFRQLAGVNYFAVDPYQIGHHNDEAIESGAFWFYRKLGFRPTDPNVAKILAREEKKMTADPLHRTTPATLRHLAAGWMIYETAGAKPGKYDTFEVRRLAMRHGGKPL